ncbi:MAG: nicotinate-nicotinamide nucleotide adenylyltransferase [Clostridia bacterium]|nr:nicotinate-nicotinamide nucleotide adenylyltransferase [Clostridia bacterium]
MKRIGFFGGCFNPPTNMHIRIANNLIKEGKLDKVVFVPMNDFYKKEGLIKSKHRYNMLKLAIEGYNNLEVDDIEIKENRKLFATDAFEIIKKSFYLKSNEETDMFLIMGSDNFNKMPNWKDYNKIKNNYKYIVINRDEKEISSTEIRNMIKNNDEEVVKYLPKEVYNYIIENELYR